MILYQFERTWGNPNLSHFCCKIENSGRGSAVARDAALDRGTSVLGDDVFEVAVYGCKLASK